MSETWVAPLLRCLNAAACASKGTAAKRCVTRAYSAAVPDTSDGTKPLGGELGKTVRGGRERRHASRTHTIPRHNIIVKK